MSAFHRLSQGETNAFLFESSEGDKRLARYSFIGVDPVKTISFKKGMVTIRDNVANRIDTSIVANPLQLLKEILKEEEIEPADNLNFPFTAGLVGYLGYGATRYFDGIEQQQLAPYDIPDGYYGLYDSSVLYDHFKRRINIISYRGEEHARHLAERLVSGRALSPLIDDGGELSDEAIAADFSGPFSQKTFMALVSRAKKFILEGQIFQIVVSQRFSLPVRSRPIDIYRILQAINPSPYAYFLKCPDFSYFGSSPETFVSCNDGTVTLRALAGTKPRGRTDEEDAEIATGLATDEKELAEHRMLVDLGRNDLGRVCRPGTVKVGPIATITKYTHVMHLATEITGQLQENKTAYEVFQSCFPRGTVSGAPKIRAMKLLETLEPEQRGIYSGVVGYFDAGGNMDGAIAIRSALVKDGIVHINAGAGVVYDSDPKSEYQETLNKARSVMKAVKLAERASAWQL